nr:argininosuccinate synthase-related protein [Pseudomonas luteola]
MIRQIRSLEDLDFIANHCKHALTLFSGGLDSSYLLYVLSKKNIKITALAIDLGEDIDTEQLQKIAKHFGAELNIIDVRKKFVEDAVLPAIQACAKYLGLYPISSSLSRPIIARVAVDLALKLGCDAIIHTANQSQNSLRRLNGSIFQLQYQGYVGSPYEYSALSREEKAHSLINAGLDLFKSRTVSGDANLWVREYESGSLDNPEDFSVPEYLFKWTSPSNSPKVNHISIDFNKGRPTGLDGKALSLIDVIESLNTIAGSHMIGRYSGLEHLEGGQKVLEVREAPAATLLLEAYRHLETAIHNAELIREKISLEQVWVREAIEGRWFGKLKHAAERFIQITAHEVSGSVTFSLRPGSFDVISIRAVNALYLKNRDAWEKITAQDASSRNLKESFI